MTDSSICRRAGARAARPRSDALPPRWEPAEISRVRTYRYSCPPPRSNVTGGGSGQPIENVLVELDCAGITGHGYVHCDDKSGADWMCGMISTLGRQLIGMDPSGVRSSWHRLRRGVTGTRQMLAALAALDTAMWDLHGMRAGLPIYQLVGSERDAVAVYVSQSVGLTSTPEIIDDALGRQAEGFRFYKLRLRRMSWRDGVDLVASVRRALNDSVSLILDADRAWTVADAVAVGAASSDLGVLWLEGPVALADRDPLATATRALDVAVATGDALEIDALTRVIGQRTADVVTPNLMRCAGPTGVLGIAGLAAAHYVAASSAAFPEISAHLLGAWGGIPPVQVRPGHWDAMFDEAPVVADGELRLPDRPGFGFTFSDEARVSC